MNGNPSKFIDTNVLLYIIGTDMEKKRIAIDLCGENAVISINVLNEFVNVCRKKFARSFEPIREDVKYFLGSLALVFPVSRPLNALSKSGKQPVIHILTA